MSGVLTLRSNQKLLANGAKVVQTATTPAIGVPIFECINKDNIEISGFYFEGNGMTYINSASSKWVALYYGGGTNLVVKNNTFNNFGYSSISSVGSSSPIVDFMFCQNKVIGLGSDALIGDIYTVTNNSGITIGGTRISILNNTISKTAQGLIIVEKSNEVIISGNLIFETAIEHGMYIDSGVSNISVTGNVLKQIEKMGIKVQNRDVLGHLSKNIVISNNVIDGTGTGGDGILIIGINDTNVFAENITVTGNTLSNIGQHGINIRSVKKAVISGNTINIVAYAGIYCSNTIDAVFSENVILNCKENGIFDDNKGSNVTYSNNYIKDIGIDARGAVLSPGIFIAAPVFGSTAGGRIIKFNTVIGHKNAGNVYTTDYGLFIEGGDLSETEIRGNTFIKNLYSGIRLPSTPSPLRYFGENIYKGNGDLDENDLIQYLPTSLQKGNVNVYFSNSLPTTGNFIKGTVIYNNNPEPEGYIGWVCTTGGKYGTGTIPVWKTFGVISA